MNVQDCEYLWILSDDDLIHPATIDYLDNNLYSCDLFFFTHSDSELQSNVWSQEDFLKNNIYTNDGAGLISFTVYNANIVRDRSYIAYQAIHTCFAHLAFILYAFKDRSLKCKQIGSSGFFVARSEGLNECSDSVHYKKSYFGYVLLSNYIENKSKNNFLKAFQTYDSLKFWKSNSAYQIAATNHLYANAVMKKYSSWLGFKLKLNLFHFYHVLFDYLYSKMTSKQKSIIKKLLGRKI